MRSASLLPPAQFYVSSPFLEAAHFALPRSLLFGSVRQTTQHYFLASLCRGRQSYTANENDTSDTIWNLGQMTYDMRDVWTLSHTDVQ